MSIVAVDDTASAADATSIVVSGAAGVGASDPVQSGIERFLSWLNKAGLHKKDYQLTGVTKMLSLETTDSPLHGCRGGFLTDEMGLGKTIQMLGLMYSNFLKRTLIVLPCSLVDQWETEIIRLLGHHPLVYHGARKHEKSLKDSPIVITTYSTLAARKSGSLTIQSPLTDITWSRVIFDEAHHLRNRKTSKHIGAANLKACIRWFVTGTPIQNVKADLFSLFSLFGIERENYTTYDGIREIAETFRIGRTKSEVGIKLPNVTYHRQMVPWSTDADLDMAADLHSILSFSQVSVSNVNKIIAMMSGSPLPALIRMRQSCILPRLMRKSVKRLIRRGLIEKTDMLKGIYSTAKMDAVMSTILERKDNGAPKLVFSHFNGEIDYLEAELTKHGMKVGVIDGRTCRGDRETYLTSDAYDVLVLQIQTACEGLNLQQYSEVYFTSPHWNPFVEDQAVARVHRIGQKKPVNVFRYEMEGFGDDTISIDTYCRLVQERKRELALLFGNDADVEEAERKAAAAETDESESDTEHMPKPKSKVTEKDSPLYVAYRVLKLTPDATDQEVKQAYRKLILKNHPDKFRTESHVIQIKKAKKFKKIKAAYEMIMG
jgi:SNF2 family DNA or RNA helicase/DnaJ-domain-containing protein 1